LNYKCLYFLRKGNLSKEPFENVVENLTAGDAVFKTSVSGDMILK
jgi:hypothetical protein